MRGVMDEYRVIEDGQTRFSQGIMPKFSTGDRVKLDVHEILEGMKGDEPEYPILKSMTKGAIVNVVEVRELGRETLFKPVYALVLERDGHRAILWENFVKEA